MPELPEVETTRRGLSQHLESRRINKILVRDARLRWPVPDDYAKRFSGVTINGITRRAKYLLWHSAKGTTLVHLGMSGSLRIVPADTPYKKHDHVEWQLEGGDVVRLHDPRRFGCVLWLDDIDDHPLLRDLGPEPLGNAFSGDWLFERSRSRKQAIKNFVMDAKQVVGVGNIYASEALFRAGIHPSRAAGRVSRSRYQALAEAVRAVLTDALAAGGTTLRDFLRNDGEPGYFRQSLNVYGRTDEACNVCGSAIKMRVIGQRSSFFCTSCQR